MAGCAAFQGSTGQIRDPKQAEDQAKRRLREIETAWMKHDETALRRWDPRGFIALSGKPPALGLVPEAVWIKPQTVLVRASWTRGPEEESGSRATRHMTDFEFDNNQSMTLLSLQGENPFVNAETMR